MPHPVISLKGLEAQSLGDQLNLESSIPTRRSIVATSRISLLFLTLASAILFLYQHPLVPMSSIYTTAAPNPAVGWHSRAVRVHGSFTPTRASLAFASQLNAPVDPEGFNAAFFAPNIVVDARGVVLKVRSQDWNSLTSLARRAVTELPETGLFRNQWRILHPRTGYPIDWLSVNLDPHDELKEVAVYGYEQGNDVLEQPVGEYTTLPPILKELFGLLQEARDGYVRGEEDTAVIDRVKEVLA
ncbi:hypothetical protein FRC02_005075 [Tulasnella sp. 418]|nr:hypothetical protein FRC02_005075 [Tulasnella sp. 418]